MGQTDDRLRGQEEAGGRYFHSVASPWFSMFYRGLLSFPGRGALTGSNAAAFQQDVGYRNGRALALQPQVGTLDFEHFSREAEESPRINHSELCSVCWHSSSFAGSL